MVIAQQLLSIPLSDARYINMHCLDTLKQYNHACSEAMLVIKRGLREVLHRTFGN